MAQQRITRDDIEANLRALQGDVQSAVDDKKQTALLVAVGVALLTLLVVFLLGKRSGKKKTTLVEIRRV